MSLSNEVYSFRDIKQDSTPESLQCQAQLQAGNAFVQDAWFTSQRKPNTDARSSIEAMKGDANARAALGLPAPMTPEQEKAREAVLNAVKGAHTLAEEFIPPYGVVAHLSESVIAQVKNPPNVPDSELGDGFVMSGGNPEGAFAATQGILAANSTPEQLEAQLKSLGGAVESEVGLAAGIALAETIAPHLTQSAGNWAKVAATTVGVTISEEAERLGISAVSKIAPKIVEGAVHGAEGIGKAIVHTLEFDGTPAEDKKTPPDSSDDTLGYQYVVPGF